MSPLTKIGRHCAICVLTFCAVLISPVILIYGPLIAIGVVADVVRAGNSPIAGRRYRERRGILDAAQSAGAGVASSCGCASQRRLK